MKENKKQGLKQLGLLIAGLIALNVFGNYFFKRFDLTADKRYTLSETSLTSSNKSTVRYTSMCFWKDSFRQNSNGCKMKPVRP